MVKSKKNGAPSVHNAKVPSNCPGSQPHNRTRLSDTRIVSLRDLLGCTLRAATW